MFNKKFLVVVMLGIGATFVFQMCKKDKKAQPVVSKETLKPQEIGWPKFTFEYRMGHDSKDCDGKGELCWMPATGILYPCHIPCWGSGDNCGITIEVGQVINNSDGTIFEGYNPTPNLIYSEIDSIFVVPNGSKPHLAPWKNFSINTTTSGYSEYINVPAQNTLIRTTTDGREFYVLKNLTYTAAPIYSDIY